MHEKIQEYDVQPQDIYNMDEKGFLISRQQKVRRVFSRKYLKSGKLLGASHDGNREWITVTPVKE
jgi:hypothetical protein